ncbi:hypothetical protein QYF36_025049 [Acer negundo]|nr:hypothetical protein QYF36_025049 [Acer negundo]
MANGDGGNPLVGDENRSLDDLWASQATLERKVDVISTNLRQILAALGDTNLNFRNCDNRLVTRSDGEIPHRRQQPIESGTDKDVERWVMGQP